jgi:hypothetical protein
VTGEAQKRKGREAAKIGVRLGLVRRETAILAKGANPVCCKSRRLGRGSKRRQRSYARAQKRQRDARLHYLDAKWRATRIYGVHDGEVVGFRVQAAGEMNGGASGLVVQGSGAGGNYYACTSGSERQADLAIPTVVERMVEGSCDPNARQRRFSGQKGKTVQRVCLRIGKVTGSNWMHCESRSFTALLPGPVVLCCSASG